MLLQHFHAMISLRFSIFLIHSSSFRRMIQRLTSILATAARWAFHKGATAVLSSQYSSTTRSTSSEASVNCHGLDGPLRTGLPIGFSPGHVRRPTSSSNVRMSPLKSIFGFAAWELVVKPDPSSIGVICGGFNVRSMARIRHDPRQSKDNQASHYCYRHVTRLAPVTAHQ
jgi:hypothetical protein